MYEYVIPLSALALSFLSFLTCLRFLASRQGFYWVLPLLNSALLTLYNFYLLLSPERAYTATPFSLIFFPLVCSIVWYLVVIIFHQALKQTVSKNKYINEQKKNYAETRFLEKKERRAYRHKAEKLGKEENAAYKPVLYNVTEEGWKAEDPN